MGTTSATRPFTWKCSCASTNRFSKAAVCSNCKQPCKETDLWKCPDDGEIHRLDKSLCRVCGRPHPFVLQRAIEWPACTPLNPAGLSPYPAGLPVTTTANLPFYFPGLFAVHHAHQLAIDNAAFSSDRAGLPGLPELPAFLGVHPGFQDARGPPVTLTPADAMYHSGGIVKFEQALLKQLPTFMQQAHVTEEKGQLQSFFKGKSRPPDWAFGEQGWVTFDSTDPQYQSRIRLKRVEWHLGAAFFSWGNFGGFRDPTDRWAYTFEFVHLGRAGDAHVILGPGDGLIKCPRDYAWPCCFLCAKFHYPCGNHAATKKHESWCRYLQQFASTDAATLDREILKVCMPYITRKHMRGVELAAAGRTHPR